MAFEVVHAVRRQTRRPLMVKLSPNVTDITRIARSALDAGADALSLINTITGMAIDIHRRRSKIANITGGLSGPAIKPVALRMVWQVAQMSSVPVVGIGGIATAEDALEFLIAGAAAVQIGTANFVDPGCAVRVVDGIRKYMIDHGIGRLTELIGSLET
jgi:dihydroorotate dehydrogenase (NAD+) catalytic subunit